jgi:hypothetical protein
MKEIDNYWYTQVWVERVMSEYAKVPVNFTSHGLDGLNNLGSGQTVIAKKLENGRQYMIVMDHSYNSYSS